MRNEVQLITYVDRFGGQTLTELQELLAGPLQGAFGGVHLLPFFYKIDGADAGFDPIDHTRVDDRLGDWSDVRKLSNNIAVMADVIDLARGLRLPTFGQPADTLADPIPAKTATPRAAGGGSDDDLLPRLRAPRWHRLLPGMFR